MKKKSLKELKEIARLKTREALCNYEVPDDLLPKIVLGYGYEDDLAIFEMYIPGPRPQDARILVRTSLNAFTGEGTVEILDLPRKESAPDKGRRT